jgi:glycine/D-amino acid oxidase-like deaminating enzyme
VIDVSLDTVIFGGGIAGLWTLNKLHNEGRQVILLESQAIGAGQTGMSQGIVHGGMKYALTGKLSEASQAIAQMPARWRDCLNGKGEVDLSSATILSEAQYLWSDDKVTSKIKSFFASKLLKSRCEPVNQDQAPALFQNKQFTGKLYRLNEMVLDVNSVLQALIAPLQDRILKIDNDRLKLHFNDSKLEFIEYTLPTQQTVRLRAKQWVFAAGEGNASLLQDAIKAPAMQTRPLRMTMLSFEGISPVYAHALGKYAVPRMTITSHQDDAGRWVWYIGGQVAEEGVEKNEATHHQHVMEELKALLPWIPLDCFKINSFIINRAEPKMSAGKRPDNFFVKQHQNMTVVWPTKLAFAPVVAEAVSGLTVDPAVKPRDDSDALRDDGGVGWLKIQADWPKAEIASPLWNSLC